MFNVSKRMLDSIPDLALPSFELSVPPIVLNTDASDAAVGSEIAQKEFVVFRTYGHFRHYPIARKFTSKTN